MRTCCFLELACYCLNSRGLKKRSVILKHLFSGPLSQDGKSTAEPASLRKPAYNVFLFPPLMAGLVLPHCFEHCVSFSLLAAELWCRETGFVEMKRVAQLRLAFVSLCFLLCQLSYLFFFLSYTPLPPLPMWNDLFKTKGFKAKANFLQMHLFTYQQKIRVLGCSTFRSESGHSWNKRYILIQRIGTFSLYNI